MCISFVSDTDFSGRLSPNGEEARKTKAEAERRMTKITAIKRNLEEKRSPLKKEILRMMGSRKER